MRGEGEQFVGEPGTPARVGGMLGERLVDTSTKHQHMAVVLIREDKSWVLVSCSGENPFSQPTLRRHLRRRMALTGVWRGRCLEVAPSGIAEAEPAGTPVEEAIPPAEPDSPVRRKPAGT